MMRTSVGVAALAVHRSIVISHQGMLRRSWMWHGAYIVVLWFMLHQVDSLVIHRPGQDSLILGHMVADFGPAKFDVSGGMMASRPVNGCTTWNTTAADPAGRLALISRGACSFFEKGTPIKQAVPGQKIWFLMNHLPSAFSGVWFLSGRGSSEWRYCRHRRQRSF